nr:PH domain-containing protein [Clostridium paridis]
MIFTLVVFCIVGIILVTGEVKVKLNDNKIKIAASYWKDQTIAYKDIQSVTYSEDLSIGRRTNGVGSLRLNEGHFNNNLFGDYILYSYTKCKSYIVIKTNSGIFVVNGKSSEDTKKLYEEIIEKLK